MGAAGSSPRRRATVAQTRTPESAAPSKAASPDAVLAHGPTQGRSPAGAPRTTAQGGPPRAKYRLQGKGGGCRRRSGRACTGDTGAHIGVDGAADPRRRHQQTPLFAAYVAADDGLSRSRSDTAKRGAGPRSCARRTPRDTTTARERWSAQEGTKPPPQRQRWRGSYPPR